MRFILINLLLSIVVIGKAQQTVTFKSADGLTITADLYFHDKSLPFILLFNQANYSRGEYLETAPKLMKFGYNCLAVDLRSGDEVNYIQDETAREALEKGIPNDYLDASKDVLAAIQYVKQFGNQPVILLGSSYSASLALLIGKDNPSVKAVIAFSPGEYFPTLSMQKKLSGFSKPLFVSVTKSEYPFVKTMLSGISENLISWYVPSSGEGTHGSSALWSSSPDQEACWLSLLMFFKQFKS